jgi:CheY-like chemotaxis protein
MRTILVVDDDDEIRLVLRLWLAALGFEVVLAAGGEEALALLQTRECDIVICDLTMPGMNGDELFSRCRERWPEVGGHFIFLNGWSQGGSDAGLAASGQPCLAKPFRLADMQAAIDRLLPNPAR